MRVSDTLSNTICHTQHSVEKTTVLSETMSMIARNMHSTTSANGDIDITPRLPHHAM